MGNEIKIIIGGDASQLVAATSKANDALGTFTGLTNQSSSALRKVAVESVNTADALKKASKAAEDIIPEGSILEARASIKRLRGEIEGLSGTQLKSSAGKFLASELKIAEQELKNLEVEAGLAKQKIEKIVPPANAGNLFKQAYGGLRTIANILPGIGVAGLIGFATEPLVNYVSSLFAAKNAMAGFTKAMEEANKQAGNELARVQVLNAVITDNTRSQSDRGKAAKELSGILKDLNINMSKEVILNGQVAEATKKATEAILSRAKARAIENRIGELSGEQLQRDLKRKDAVDNLAKATKSLNDQQKIQGQVIGGSSLGVSGNTIGATQKVIALQGELKNLDKASAEANKEIAFLISQIQDKDLKIDKGGGGDDKVVDILKQRIAALKEIQSLQGLDAKQRVELVQLEIKLINRDGPKLGFNPAEIKQQADAILEKEFPVKTFEYQTLITTRVNKLDFSIVKEAKALTEGFKTDIAKAIGIDGKPLEIQAPSFRFTDVKTKTDIALDELKKAINQQIEGTFVNAGAALGEAIGRGFEGKKDLFSSLMPILGEGLKQIGKALLAFGAATLALQISLDTLNPFIALAAGVVAIAAGEALKNSVPKFAEGGIVNRATLGIFGEAGPEMIIPLDRLPDIVGKLSMNTSANVMLAPTLRFSLTDMELGLERVRSSRKRLG